MSALFAYVSRYFLAVFHIHIHFKRIRIHALNHRWPRTSKDVSVIFDIGIGRYNQIGIGENSVGLKYLTPVSIGLYSILTFEPILILDCPNTEAIRYEKIIQFWRIRLRMCKINLIRHGIWHSLGLIPLLPTETVQCSDIMLSLIS